VYLSNQSQYPARLAQYQAAQRAYPAKLAAYQTAIKKHVKPTPATPKQPIAPVAPKQPVAPTKPELNATSLALPGLYALLSIAYLYLGYRASRTARLNRTNAGPTSAR
jgi:hypothetical protein